MTETLAVKVGALMVVSALAILLWQAAVPRAVAAAHDLFDGSRVVSATVTGCVGQGPLRRDCRVSYAAADGRAAQVPLTDPGLFAVAPGDRLPVRVDAGTVAVTGWRALTDAGLLLALAVVFTRFTIELFRRVLAHDDRPYSGGDPEDDDR